MNKHIIGKLFIFLCVLASNANAFTINADADIHITTRYVECQSIADRIIELVHRYLDAKDDVEKVHFGKKVEKKKKKLKKCQKRNKRLIMPHLARGQVGLEFRF